MEYSNKFSNQFVIFVTESFINLRIELVIYLIFHYFFDDWNNFIHR